MAQLDVQPKKSSPTWIWVLAGIILLVIIFYFLRDGGETASTANNDDTTAVSAVVTEGADNWGMVDMNAPEARYEEVDDTAVSVRGNDDYAIYAVNETILFDSDQSAIRPQAEAGLKQIAASAEKRFSGGHIRIYGYTDARGSTGANKELATERANAVKNWLVNNGNISADRISVNAPGEARPVGSNATEEGRQENRRVEIVVKRTENN